jgi:ATP diphosphatase
MSDRHPAPIRALRPAPSDADPLRRLQAIMARLRDPEDGCPWDVEQDFASIAPYTIEEAYEVADAIARGSMAELRDELGDLLLQVVYHSQMARERGAFSLEDVAEAICAKMIRRHPHVFDHGPDGRDAQGQTAAWEAIKAAERAGKTARASVLDDIALALPGLTRALKLQRRAARVGFDWPDTDAVLDKIVEEARELADERGGDPDRIEDEFGDLLFVIVNLGRHLDVDAEAALRRTNAKFERRFRAVEQRLAQEGKTPSDSDLAEMDALWEAVKREERSGNV